MNLCLFLPNVLKNTAEDDFVVAFNFGYRILAKFVIHIRVVKVEPLIFYKVEHGKKLLDSWLRLLNCITNVVQFEMLSGESLAPLLIRVESRDRVLV